MQVLIVGALQEEIDGLLSELKGREDVRAGAFVLHRGSIFDHTVYLCKCGVGKVYSAAATAAALTQFPEINCVLNIGVSGGIGGSKRGTIVISDKTVHHDYDSTPSGLRLGQLEDFDSEFLPCDNAVVQTLVRALQAENLTYRVGTIASGDQFIASKAKGDWITSTFGAIACDFESAPINQVCLVFGVPFAAVRAISDNGDEDAIESFNTFLQRVAAHGTRAVKKFLEIA